MYVLYTHGHGIGLEILVPVHGDMAGGAGRSLCEGFMYGALPRGAARRSVFRGRPGRAYVGEEYTYIM